MDDSLFVSDQVHEREVKLPNGKTHKLFFREVTENTFAKYRKALRSEDELEREGAAAFLISESLRNPDGSQALTIEKASSLKPVAMNEIIKAILVVNDLKADEGND